MQERSLGQEPQEAVSDGAAVQIIAADLHLDNFDMNELNFSSNLPVVIEHRELFTQLSSKTEMLSI